MSTKKYQLKQIKKREQSIVTVAFAHNFAKEKLEANATVTILASEK